MNVLYTWLATLLIVIGGSYMSPVFAQLDLSSTHVVRLEASMGLAQETALKEEGIQVLHYYGDQTYLLSALPRTVKTSPADVRFSQTEFLKELDVSAGEQLRVDLVLAHPKAAAGLQSVLAKAGFKASAEQLLGGVTLTGAVSSRQLRKLLENPLILDATPVMDDEVIPYNLEGRIAGGVTPLNSGIAGAPDLNGQGVVLGIGDGGMLSNHPDIGDRVIHSTTYYNPSWGSHPDMVAGIMAGAGNVFSEHQGVACEVELIIQPSTAIVYYAPDYLNTYQMSITNNSYGPSFHCNTANKYYGTSANVDQQLFDNPSLLHVFAVGNSGGTSCYGNPTSYSTIPGGAQNSKNALSVGNAKFDRTRNLGSSAGPTFDGRLKPEIMAIGNSVTSNNRSAGYSTGSGTSYASPGVAATLGLLTQRYKALNAGALPDGALLKAIACNTADDIGAVGPDFQHGYGLINGVKALEAIENSTYTQRYIAQGAQYSQAVTTTASTEQVKFMLYWADQAGSTTNTGSTLVNDFDLLVVNPAGDTLRPWVLDPANPTALAVRTTDTLNNIEQVTIDNPTAGTYTILVDGKELPYGSTDFVLSWVIEEPEVMLTCPFGGESLTPNENVYIAWAASPGQTGTWKVEYSLDGAPWQTIQSGITEDTRHIKWLPTFENVEAELRVTNETSQLSDQTNEPTVLLGMPENVFGAAMCDGSVMLQWSSVDGVSEYQVYKYDGSQMVPVATASDTFIILDGLASGVDSLFSVASLSPSGKTSQRSYALNQKSEVDGPGCQSPLPVEWVSIEATQVESDVEIAWTVAAELDNARFEVLRSATGADWTMIGEVEGRGTAQSAKTYVFYDTAAGKDGITYYQIKQVDFDGGSDLSEIVAHTYFATRTTSSASIALAQNPVVDDIYLVTSNSAEMEVVLFDLAGRALRSFHLQPGERTIAWPSGLNAGMYVLQARMSGGVASMRLLKG